MWQLWIFYIVPNCPEYRKGRKPSKIRRCEKNKRIRCFVPNCPEYKKWEIRPKIRRCNKTTKKNSQHLRLLCIRVSWVEKVENRTGLMRVTDAYATYVRILHDIFSIHWILLFLQRIICSHFLGVDFFFYFLKCAVSSIYFYY